MSNVGTEWVAPPNWPQPPVGWSPPLGWTPDRAWGPPPDGWVWWQPHEPQYPPFWKRRTIAYASPQFKKGTGWAFAVIVVLIAGGAVASNTEPAVKPVAQEDAGRPAAAASEPAATVAPAEPRATGTAVAPAAANAPRPLTPAKPKQAPGVAAVPLLMMAAGGDGDSWRDTNGVEYRMGLINTPETNECGGSAATAYRKRALAAGFRAKIYATDHYGRKVSVIVAPNGVNLNVAMARDGIANDKYLQQFRHENPQLANQLDGVFASAKADRAGVWSACRSGDAPQGIVTAPQPAEPAPAPAAAGDCHPDYATCIPVQGTGSGRGQANDLDCGDLTGSVRLRSAGVDPYRLDADSDGVGCE